MGLVLLQVFVFDADDIRESVLLAGGSAAGVGPTTPPSCRMPSGRQGRHMHAHVSCGSLKIGVQGRRKRAGGTLKRDRANRSKVM